jgi:protein-S-isoprenylcysteine O-methyltransferase Ste14
MTEDDVPLTPDPNATPPLADWAPLSARPLILRVAIRWLLGVVGIGALLFLPAGTWAYWPGWLYCGVLFIPMLFVAGYLLEHDPALLERRLRSKERYADQRVLISLFSLVVLAGFTIPGFDFRFGWSHVPTAVIVGSAAIVLAGYLLFFSVLRTNSYASRVVEVEAGQAVITTGPYARVRHPMYTAFLLMYLFTPLALGSYWALLPFALIVPLLVLRIRSEERVLRRDLDGYAVYCEQVRHRLIPGIW